MKRSEINAVIKRFEKLLEEHRFELPPFCKWTPEEWQTKGHEYDEIRDNMLGWDLPIMAWAISVISALRLSPFATATYTIRSIPRPMLKR